MKHHQVIQRRFVASALFVIAANVSAQSDPYYDAGGMPVTNAASSPALQPESTAAAVPNPKLMFERSNVVGIDNVVNAYSVPVTDSSGTVKYWDITITFTPDPDGVVPASATVTKIPSPIVTSRPVVQGNYIAVTPKGKCTVTNYALQSGRKESLFQCIDDNGYSFQMAVLTGAVNSTHPYYAQLSYAKIDKRPDVKNYFWGIVTNQHFSVSFLSGCGYVVGGFPVGAQQVGTQLVLSLFGTNGSFVCTSTMTKTN